MKFKAVLSDLGNVVAPFDNSRTFRAIAAETGIRAEQVEHVIMTTCEPLLMEYELGLVDDEMFYDRLCMRLGVAKRDLKRSDFVRAYCSVFELNNEVLNCWARCRKAGATLVAVSNICPLRHAELMNMGALDLFDRVVVSYRERHRKPSVEIMVRALDRAAVAAEEALFVDDIAANLEPAKELGMITHHFTTNDNFLRFMSKMGAP